VRPNPRLILGASHQMPTTPVRAAQDLATE